MMGKRETFSDQIRRLILSSELSRYKMAKRTGVHESRLSRFIHSNVGLSMDAMDKLAGLLGWRVVEDRPADKPKRRRTGKDK